MKEAIQLSDYHTHAKSHGPEKESPLRVEAMVQAAKQRGLVAICLTDHLPLPPRFVDPTPDQGCAMLPKQYEEYQEQVIRVARSTEGITVLRGVEADYLPGYEDWTRSQIAKYPYDYALGSVHFLGNNGNKNLLLDFGTNGFKECATYYGTIENLVKTYFGQVQEMAKTGMFDAVGHIDLVKKDNKVLYDGSNKLSWTWFSGDEPWYRDAVLETLGVITEKKMAIELNTSGWDKACQEQYPSLWILQEARQRQISLIISSDAHIPENVGKNFDRAVMLARSAGYRSLVRFVNRERQEVSI